ncbi:hypothetical protein [uncultured Pseudodesulfovibrio sp.]|uniref:hypothetical protein n=1 Tax=uncultured Pseudodesulfovibrio sp. TaxID=2035858 RepID=UPI0029C98C98|nr:hypothetical protein [uncultured Pseudodesulfovibrio sp.]
MDNRLSDEYLAELGLAATETDRTPGPCPSAEDLAALQEGRLDAARRTEVLAHLDACAGCMARWLAVSSDGALPVADPAPKAFSPRLIQAVAAIAAVAACLFLAVHFIPMAGSEPDFVRFVDSGYRLVLDDSSLYAELDGPVRELAASVETRSEETPAARTFKAGWQAGLVALGKGEVATTDTADNERAAYVFSAGRWSALLHAVLSVDRTPGQQFWKEQARVAVEFRDKTTLLAPQDRERLNAVWGDMTTTMERLAEGPETDRYRDRLRRLLKGLGRILGELDIEAG